MMGRARVFSAAVVAIATIPPTAQAQTTAPSTVPPSIVATTAPGLLGEATWRVLGLVQDRAFQWRLGQRGELWRPALTASAGDDTAGAPRYPHGAWLAGSYTHTRASQGSFGYDADTGAGYVGFDRAIDERTLIGLSAGYEHTHADRPSDGSSSRSDGIPFTLYLSHRFDDRHSVTLSGSYTPLDIDTRRPGNQGGRVTGGLDGRRWMASAQGAGLYRGGAVLYGWEADYVYAEDRFDSFVESDGTAVDGSTTSLQRVAATAVLGAPLGPVVIFGRLGYGYKIARDVAPGASGDRGELVTGLDVNFAQGDRIAASLTANYSGGRDETDSWILRAVLVARF